MLYDITDPLTNRKFTISGGDAPPSLEDVEEIVAQYHKDTAPSRKDIQAAIAEASQKYNVAPHLIDAVVKAESNYDAYALSPKGAQGIAQLMPQTAQDLGVADVWDYRQNIDGGAKYLAGLLQRFGGDNAKAIIAYNWGPGNVEKFGVGAAPTESRTYYKTVSRTMRESEQWWKKFARAYFEKYLPWAGMTAGGIVGAPAGLPGTIAGSALGAALAGQVGRIAESKIFQEPIWPEQESEYAAQEALAGGASTLAGSALGAVLSPAAKLVNRAVLEPLIERALPFSPRAALKPGGKVIKTFTDLIQRFPPGSWATNKAREQTNSALVQASDDLIAQMGLQPSYAARGLFAQSKEAYKAAENLVPLETRVSLDETARYIEGRAREKVLKPYLGIIKDIADRGEQATVADALKLSSSVWPKTFQKLSRHETAVLTGLKDALQKDISVIDAAAGTKILDTYNVGRELHALGKTVQKTAKIEKILNNSIVTVDDVRVLNPIALKKEIDRELPTLTIEFKKTPDVIDRLLKFRDDALLYQYDLSAYKKALAKPFGWQDIASIGIGGGGLAGTMFSDSSDKSKIATYVVLPALAQYALARSIIKPSGIMNKYFTDRLFPLSGAALNQLTRALANVGAVEALQYQREK